MTEPTPDPTSPAEGAGQPAPGPELVQLAGQVFDFARDGDTDKLVARLDAGLPVETLNESGDSLLMLAAYYGHAGSVQALLEHGADPNRINDRGQSPLAGAVFKSAYDVINALVEGGADPSAGVPSAIETAEMFGKTDLLKLFGAQ